MYENKKILILGAARSGLAVAKVLGNKNNDITLSDIKPLAVDDKKALEELGIKVIITENQTDLIDDSYDLIVKNPAIMYTSEITKKIEELNVRCENEIEVAYHFLPKDVTIIGVTGSNGKTTTTTIIYELLKRSNVSVVLGGNIGYPLCSVLNDIKSGDVLLLEISDHQLCDIHDFKTDISVLTNIFPTHLDYHGTYEHYKMTKKNIFNLHGSSDLAIINKNNSDSLEVSADILSKKIYFNDDANYYDESSIYLHGSKYLDIADIRIKGSHNYENILAALLVVENFGVTRETVKEFLQGFGGVAHRIEWVTSRDGVDYYNDSKSTNPTATITALNTFSKPIHLILGGLDRKQDFNDLNDYMQNVKKIYAIGEVTDRLEDYARKINIPCEKCYKLDVALNEIKKNVQSGEIVLLSPASSSQDQYVKFEDRGDEFKNIVENF